MPTNKRNLAWFLWPVLLAFPLQLLMEGVYELATDLGIVSLVLGFAGPRSSKIGFKIDLLPVCFGFFAAIIGWACVEQARRRAIQANLFAVAFCFIALSLGAFFHPYYSCGTHLLTLGKYLVWGVEFPPFGPMDFDLGLEGCCVSFGKWKIVAAAWVTLSLFGLTAPMLTRCINALDLRIWPGSPEVGFRSFHIAGPIAAFTRPLFQLIDRLTKATATKPVMFFLYSMFPLAVSLAWDSLMARPSERAHALISFELASAARFSVPVHAGSLFLAFIMFPTVLLWLELVKAAFIAHRFGFPYSHLVSGQLLSVVCRHTSDTMDLYIRLLGALLCFAWCSLTTCL